MPIFYAPIVCYIALLSLRYRGLTFLSVNPGLPMSGLYGERKADLLNQLRGSEYLANFIKLKANSTLQNRMQDAEGFMQLNNLSFPVVLKPDYGQRGLDVAVIRDKQAMVKYLTAATGDVLLQEHVAGEEFGVFYLRYPQHDKAKLFSITEKTFPIVMGDGVSTLEQLLMENPRTHYMAEYLLKLHAERLTTILAAGEVFKVVEIGSHCRGSVFLDGNQYISSELLAKIDSLSQKLDGYFFGRYDIRAESAASLQAGESFKVLELNGVTSESTDIYDPNNSVITAYKILFKQWHAAFEIGKQNIALGAKKVSLVKLLSYIFSMMRGKSHSSADTAY